MTDVHDLQDEIFHIPQAQQYCKGNFGSWDPMITTPPGLYVLFSLVPLPLAPSSGKFDPSSLYTTTYVLCQRGKFIYRWLKCFS